MDNLHRLGSLVALLMQLRSPGSPCAKRAFRVGANEGLCILKAVMQNRLYMDIFERRGQESLVLLCITLNRKELWGSPFDSIASADFPKCLSTTLHWFQRLRGKPGTLQESSESARSKDGKQQPYQSRSFKSRSGLERSMAGRILEQAGASAKRPAPIWASCRAACTQIIGTSISNSRLFS